MKKKPEKIRSTIKTKLFMPQELKKNLVDKNLVHVVYISLVLMTFSFTLFCLTLVRRYGDYSENLQEILYYAVFFIIALSGFILAKIFQKLENLNQMVRNIPLLFLFFVFLCLSLYLYHYGPNPFNGFITFLVIATIAPLAFAIEPLIYNPMIILVFICISSSLENKFGSGAVANGSLFIAVLFFLSNVRWRSLMRRMEHEKLVEDHDQTIQREFEMASMVQKSFYTHDLSGIKNWEVVYYNNPMLSLSGDLFDFFNRQDKLSGLCIFDVSGHGLSSGLVTMMVKNAMEEEFYENDDVELGYTMQRINQRIRKEKGNIENYLTGIMLRLSDEKIEMVNAGHPVPIIYNSKINTAEYFRCSYEDRQGVIGLGDLDFFFNTLEFKLEQNDRLILYTDGITDAKNSNGELFGKERFLESVQVHSDLNPQEQMEAVVKDVEEFIGKAPKTDDISIIILKKK